MIDANELLLTSIKKHLKNLSAYDQAELCVELSKAGNFDCVKYMLENDEYANTIDELVAYDSFSIYNNAKTNKIKQYIRANYPCVVEYLKYRKHVCNLHSAQIRRQKKKARKS